MGDSRIKSRNQRHALGRLLRGPESESGAVAVEFGLIVTMLFSLIFAVVEFGRLIFTLGVLNYATEEATRYAIVNYDDTAATIQAVAEEKFILINPGRIIDFTVSAPIDPNDKTKLITVALEYEFQFLLPIVGSEPIRMTASSRGFLAEE